jgi:hypothetical protein
MPSRIRRGLAWGGALALTAMGCASQQQQQPANPVAQQVESQQKISQEALNRANEAQKRASDQGRKAALALEDVQKKQQAFIQSQQTARREQAKAEQLQREARQLTAQSSQQAAQSQQQAMQSLQQQTRAVQQGQLTTLGQLVAVDAQQVVLQPQNGDQPLTFKLTGRTNVRVDGRKAPVSEVQQGYDALVSYEVSGSTQPEALAIDVIKGGGGPGQGAAGAAPPQGTPAPQGTIPSQGPKASQGMPAPPQPQQR